MTSNAPVSIEVLNFTDRVPAGEPVPLTLVIHRKADENGPVVIPHINHRDQRRVTLNTDLLSKEVLLHPGESYTVTLAAEFEYPGSANLNDFYLQVDPPEKDRTSGGTIVPFPGRPIRVVPSLSTEIQVSIVRICGYDQGVKAEILLRHTGASAWEDFEVHFGPAETIRAGKTCLRQARLEPGTQERLDVVVAGERVELVMRGTKAGDAAEARRTLVVPPEGSEPTGYTTFGFLEPRSITTDRITVHEVDNGPQVPMRRGVFSVSGGQRYIVTVYPNHSEAEDVKLLGAPGLAEAEPMKSDGRAWSFLITTFDHSWLTQLVRLYYDVAVPGRVLRGELYFSVHPSNGKLWTIAATAGLAMTVKGISEIVPAVMSPEKAYDDMLPGLLKLFSGHWTDWLLLLSIPLIWGALSSFGRIARIVRGW